MCNFIDKVPNRRGRPVHPPAAHLGYTEEPENIDAEAEWATFDTPQPNNRMDSDATVVNKQPTSVQTTAQNTTSAGKKTAVGKAVMQAGLVAGSPVMSSTVDQVSSYLTPSGKKSAWNPFKSKKKHVPGQPESSLDARSKIFDKVPFGPKRRTLPAKNNAGEGSSASMAEQSGRRPEQNEQGTGASTTAGVGNSTVGNLTANLPFIQVSPVSESNSTRPSTAIAGPSGQIPQQNEDRTGASTTAGASNMIADFLLYDDDSTIGSSTTMPEPSGNWQGLFGASTGTANEVLAATEGIENSDTGNIPLTDDQESMEREATAPEGSAVRELDSDGVAASVEPSEERTGMITITYLASIPQKSLLHIGFTD